MKFLARYRKEITWGLVLGSCCALLLIYCYNKQNKQNVQEATTSANGAANTTQSLGSNTSESEFGISIPAIGIHAPIITGIDPTDEKAYDEALTKGVLTLPTEGIVGRSGNSVIYGHSSSNENNIYGTIFSKLNDLDNGDEIIVTDNNGEYKYAVSSKKIVEATDLSVLDNTDDETLTIMTCWPLGTDEKRLIVVAKRK